MDTDDTSLLRDFWYLALPGHGLQVAKTTRLTILDEPLLICRASDNSVFAVRDICPHRGIPLSYGSFDGQEITCSYHGWRFASDGRCTAIPSLMPDQKINLDRIGVKSYPCREVQGQIWVYIGDEGDDTGSPPEVPMPTGAVPGACIQMSFPCHTDHAAYGLMDPTHAAFVHTSWWWKKDARKLRAKEKRFEPAPLGWCMARHSLPSEHRLYRLLGKDVTTEITYSLPGIRIEHISGSRHSAAGLTAITPISATETVVHQSLYWTAGWLGIATPVVRHLMKTFLGQDRDVVVKQQEGLRYDPPLILIDDADTQGKWYSQVKREWLSAREEEREFQNPVKARTLRWHS
jgi:phenylpropionate dioxygenase-like ring-hydroxylating dioxygenase large terminal subunit